MHICDSASSATNTWNIDTASRGLSSAEMVCQNLHLSQNKRFSPHLLSSKNSKKAFLSCISCITDAKSDGISSALEDLLGLKYDAGEERERAPKSEGADNSEGEEVEERLGADPKRGVLYDRDVEGGDNGSYEGREDRGEDIGEVGGDK